MTNEQKTVVESLRSQGLGYKRIAAQTGISANTVKSYLRKNAPVAVEQETPVISPESAVVISSDIQPVCRQCGKPVAQNPGRKEKKFCSDHCRNLWWNAHLSEVKRKAMYEYVCPNCGKPFYAYGNRKRKYCSHDCYVADRFGDAVCD